MDCVCICIKEIGIIKCNYGIYKDCKYIIGK